MSSKSHSLNLYDLETGGEKFEVDVTQGKIDVKTGGTKSMVFNMPVKLIDGVGGDIASVSTKLHDIDAAIAAGNAGSAAASALVQSNLTAYQTSNDTALATVSATVTTNKAQQDANHASDAAARVALQTTLQDAIDDEEAARIAADAVLTSSLATEVTNRATAVSAEASTRAAADTSLQTQIDTEKARIDGILAGSSVNLDSFLEVVNQYTTLNTDALAQIASLNTALVALTARVDELTSP